MSELNDIADAVVTEVNATTFSAPYASITSVRGRLPQYSLEDMDTLHVTVVPKGVAVDPAVGTREHQQHDFAIDLAVQKNPANASDGSRDDSAFDDLDDLLEEIVDHFRMIRLPGRTSVTCNKVEYVVTESPEHLEKFGMFMGVVTFTFRKMR
jgi:hypothetical protein